MTPKGRRCRHDVWVVAILLSANTIAVFGQQTPEERYRQALEQIKVITDAALEPPVPPPPTEQTIDVPCGAVLQTAVTAARAADLDTTLRLEPGCTYNGTVTVVPSPTSRMLRISTAGWQDKGEGFAGLVTPADAANMATIVGSPGAFAAFDIQSGPVGAGHFTAYGIEARCAHVDCNIFRIGDRVNALAANSPDEVIIKQVLVRGSPTWGTLRGIYAGGRNIVITQTWCDEIWKAGQDSQCIGVDNGGQNVSVTFNYLAAGSENLIIGGAPILGPEMHPRGWVITDNVLHKPLRWQTDGQARQVKNLLEVKYGSDILIERNLLVNTWPAAQDGTAILLHFTTGGACPQCGPLEDTVLRDVVVLGATAGISLQGYSYQSTAQTASHLERVLIEYSYIATSSGRPLKFENVRDRHDVTVRRTTFRNASTTWFVGGYGQAWTANPLEFVSGGPILGFRYIDNVVRRNGTYGATAPSSTHYGAGLGTFITGDREVSGNVFGDGPSNMNTQIANYNQHIGAGTLNVRVTQAEIDPLLPADACGEWTIPDPNNPTGPRLPSGKGADCSRLAPVFARLAILPEP